MSSFQLGSWWKQEHTNAFLDLKTAITSRPPSHYFSFTPVLQAPKYDGSHFVITTDGCAEGFVAVLLQRIKTQTPAGKWVERLH
ncbi:uncharacterized protein BJ212DRAFT_1230112, partial [Suillus subaureus]